ncbi:MAG: hypothetical protein EOO04_07770 [Chitinophagaceae bacterium]|nr:MAG: hypothetical protein EOO04_07770 [Chitinophagaceae bacterium]
MNNESMVDEIVVEENPVGVRLVPGLTVLVFLVFSDIRLMWMVRDQDAPGWQLTITAYILAWVTIYFLLTSQRKAIRVIAEVVLFSVIYTDIVYLLMSAYPFSFPDAINIRNNFGYASGAITSFSNIFLVALFVTAGCFVLVKRLLVTAPVRKKQWKKTLIPLNTVLATAAFFSPAIFDFLPGVYRVPGNLLAASIMSPEDKWQRASVNTVNINAGARDVVLVIDESISATALSINDFQVSTTPFLNSNRNAYTNFGIACSFTNFSAGSNFALVSGLTPDDLPDYSFKAFARPSVFQFAKEAGYTTYLLDAQTDVDQLHNYTTKDDLQNVDEVYRPHVADKNLPLFYRDQAVGERLLGLIADKESSFILINKFGAHWPYHVNYPPSYRAAGIPDRDKTSNEYLTAVAWSVDKFWKRIMPALNGPDVNAVIIYTADHGENFDAGLYQMRHASVYNAAVKEGQVPLLLIDRAGLLPENFLPEPRMYSHAQIFPTLLQAMGYDKAAIFNDYGSGLMDPLPEEKPWFLTGDLFGRGKNYRRSAEVQSSLILSSNSTTASTPSLNSTEAWSK